jgi:hypothetical protein
MPKLSVVVIGYVSSEIETVGLVGGITWKVEKSQKMLYIKSPLAINPA